MKEKMRKSPGRRVLRFLLLLLLLGILGYAAVIGFVSLREAGVAKDVSQNDNYDAIIVLGAQVRQDGTLSNQLSLRLDKAMEAWKQKPVPIVVCGAQGQDEPTTEAWAMRNHLLGKGVPENQLLMDETSFNTQQNLSNARMLLQDFPEVKDVLIVTSDYHVPRALAMAEDLGLRASGLGSPCLREYWLKNHTREALAWIKYWAVKYLKLPL